MSLSSFYSFKLILTSQLLVSNSRLLCYRVRKKEQEGVWLPYFVRYVYFTINMATQGSRMSSLFSTLPLTTTAMITLNVVLQLVQYAAIPNIAEFAISPYYVIYLGQYYRVVTSSFFHGSLSHIAMNMLSFSSFAPPLVSFPLLVFLFFLYKITYNPKKSIH